MGLSKSLGQNFLQDHNILRKEVSLVDVDGIKDSIKRERSTSSLLNGKVVLEIGPGDGRLTEKILEKNPKKLIIVEKDERFAKLLKQRFIDEQRIEVVEADFLDYEIPKIDFIFGNIPYYISSMIIFKLKDYKFEKAVLMVQKEFAEKMVAKPNEKNYGRLSVTSQIFFEVKFIQKVPSHLFKPKPRVDSALIVLKPTSIQLTQKQEDFIRLLFSQKNRTIRAILNKKVDDLKPFEKFLQIRPRTLTKEQVLDLVSIQ